MITDLDALADQLRRWTIHDLLADPYAVSRVPTLTLRWIDRDAMIAVTAKEMHDGAREQIQQLRIRIAQTMHARRTVDQEVEKTPPAAPERAGEAIDDTPAPSDAEIALRMLQALVQLASGNGHQDDHPGGGSRQPRVPVRPVNPGGPAPAATGDIGF